MCGFILMTRRVDKMLHPQISKMRLYSVNYHYLTSGIQNKYKNDIIYRYY